MSHCSHLPPRYRQARILTNECGPYQIQAALEAYGKTARIDDLYLSPLHRRFDVCLPTDAWLLLNERGVTARLHFWRRETFFMHTLHALRNDRSVMFVLRAIGGNHRLHWNSIWGFTSEHMFSVYDSHRCERTGGAGNVEYSPAQVARALPWHGTFVLEVGA